MNGVIGHESLLAEVQGAVAHGAAGSGRVAEDLRRVIARQFRPARRFAERAAARADGDPRIIGDNDVLDGDDERVAALGAFEINRTADGVGMRRAAIETGTLAGDGLVGRRFEIAGAGVPGLDLEALARTNAKERFVAPIEGVLAGLLSRDALHKRPQVVSRQ